MHCRILERMGRRWASIGVAAAAAGVVAFIPGSAAADEPSPVTFSDNQVSVSGTPGAGNTFDVVAVGTSVATGAVTGTFAIVDHTVIAPGGNIHVDRVATGGGGSIAIRIDARFVAPTSTTESVEGNWAIVSGTGSYANLAGAGSYSATVTRATHTIVGTLSGIAVYAPAS